MSVVTIVGGLELYAVEEVAEILETLLVVELLEVGHVLLFQQPSAHYEDGAIHIGVDDLRIGHNVNGRTVNDDIIKGRFHVFNQLAKPLIADKLRGVGRNAAYGQYEQILVVFNGHDYLLHIVHEACQIVAQSLAWTADILRRGGAAQVAINNENALSLECKGRGGIHRNEGFAAAWLKGGNADDGALLVALGEFDIGAQHAEGFVDNIAHALVDDNRGRYILLAQQVADASFGFGEGNLAKAWQVQFLEVVLAANLLVGQFDDIDDKDGDEQTQCQGNGQELCLLRASGTG